MINGQKILAYTLVNAKENKCHVRLLQQASKFRLIPKQVHRVIKLKQGRCLVPYICLNFSTIQYLAKQFKIIESKKIYELWLMKE